MRVRVWVDATASVTPVPNPPPHRVWNLVGEDISEAGIRLLSPESFPVKSRLRLEVYPEDQGLPVLTIGEVVWIEQFPEASRWRLGVKFSELSEEARAGVRELVRGRPPARH